MAVNGVEIKVGQVWRINNGMTVRLEADEGETWPFRGYTTGTGRAVARYDTNGNVPVNAPQFVLAQLLVDENGFTIWRGGEQPKETKGKTVEYRMRDGVCNKQLADSAFWSHGNLVDSAEIVAYKIVEERTPGMSPAHAAPYGAPDADALAAETLSALGYRFDGQGWVQDEETAAPAAPLDLQVGGDHYKSLTIQPIEYIHANNIPFAEGSVIKYVSRWRAKNGIKDLEKARHFIDLLIQLEQRAQEGGAA